MQQSLKKMLDTMRVILEKYTVCKSYAHLLKQIDTFWYSTSASDSGPSTKLGQYAVF